MNDKCKTCNGIGSIAHDDCYGHGYEQKICPCCNGTGVHDEAQLEAGIKRLSCPLAPNSYDDYMRLRKPEIYGAPTRTFHECELCK